MAESKPWKITRESDEVIDLADQAAEEFRLAYEAERVGAVHRANAERLMEQIRELRRAGVEYREDR